MRKNVENLPLGKQELFFHAEPFDVACAQAGRELEVTDHLERYLQIRDHKHKLA